MAGCKQEGITDAAFSHLGAVKVLCINFCSQETITDAAFAHLTSVEKLSMMGCTQSTISTETRRRYMEDTHKAEKATVQRAPRVVAQPAQPQEEGDSGGGYCCVM